MHYRTAMRIVTIRSTLQRYEKKRQPTKKNCDIAITKDYFINSNNKTKCRPLWIKQRLLPSHFC